ncbi:hypothetical protein SAMN05444158_6271 [Bradyrhizobium canariense]|uniref:Uncharacterized protein n=2 Tax=Bradyrhizobium canariense TaxID=255045 RepID=A0A1H2ALR9_9BRAD|nr:hypothetical protein SAMN05444158_6271 [Bradyrhizobium canariense]
MTLLIHHDARSDHRVRRALETDPGKTRTEAARATAKRGVIRSAITMLLIMTALVGIIALKTEIYLARLTSPRLTSAELVDSAKTKVATAIADGGQAKAGQR